LAKDNNGAYVVAANGKEDMQSLAHVIHGKYKAQQQGQVKVKQRIEYFYYPLGLGLLFLLVGLSSLPRFKGREQRKRDRTNNVQGGTK